MPFHLTRHWHAEQIEKGRSNVDRLGELGDASASLWTPRVVGEQRDVHDLLVEVHAVLGPEIVLAQQEPVVGREHERGVLPHVMAIEIVEQPAELVVAERQRA